MKLESQRQRNTSTICTGLVSLIALAMAPDAVGMERSDTRIRAGHFYPDRPGPSRGDFSLDDLRREL